MLLRNAEQVGTEFGVRVSLTCHKLLQMQACMCVCVCDSHKRISNFIKMHKHSTQQMCTLHALSTSAPQISSQVMQKHAILK